MVTKDGKVELKGRKPQLVGVFRVKNFDGGEVADESVAVFGCEDGQTLQVTLERATA